MACKLFTLFKDPLHPDRVCTCSEFFFPLVSVLCYLLHAIGSLHPVYCMNVCVSVRERERIRKRERKREQGKDGAILNLIPVSLPLALEWKLY